MSFRFPRGVATTYNDADAWSEEVSGVMNGKPLGSKGTIVRPTDAAAQGRGEQAEALAAAYLTRQGLRIIARNVRCRGGEIDLICLERGTVVFVEVRLRSGDRYGGAGASITAHKQRRIVLAAQWWLGGAGMQHARRACRFDAVLLDRLDPRSLNWIRGAFGADGS